MLDILQKLPQINMRQNIFFNSLVGDNIFSLNFITNASSLQFNPVFTTNSGVLTWDLGDTSTNVSSNSPVKNYATVGNKII